MEQQSNDQTSRLDDYQKRLEELMEATRGGIQRQAPEVLDSLAATAGSIARRLEDLAREVRKRAAEKESTSEPVATSTRESEPADMPSPSSGESGPTEA